MNITSVDTLTPPPLLQLKWDISKDRTAGHILMVPIEHQEDGSFSSTMMVMDIIGFAVFFIRSEGKNNDDRYSL